MPLARRLAGGAVVEEAAALVEEEGLGRIEVFGVVGRVHRPPAKGNRLAPRIADRKHDPVAEGVIGRLALVGGLQKPRLEHQIVGNAFRAQRLAQPFPAGGRKADFPPLLRGRRKPAPREITARLGGGGCLDLQAIPLHRLFHHSDQLAPPVGLFLRPRIALGDRHSGLAGEDLDRLGKAHILGLADKGDRVALGVAAEAIIVALPVIDMKRGRFFLMERARRPEVALAGVGLALIPHDLSPHDLREAQAISELI